LRVAKGKKGRIADGASSGKEKKHASNCASRKRGNPAPLQSTGEGKGIRFPSDRQGKEREWKSFAVFRGGKRGREGRSGPRSILKKKKREKKHGACKPARRRGKKKGADRFAGLSEKRKRGGQG